MATRWDAFAEQVVATPVVGAEQELAVGGVREVAQRLAVVAGGQPAGDVDAGGELGGADRCGRARARRRGCGDGGQGEFLPEGSGDQAARVSGATGGAD